MTNETALALSETVDPAPDHVTLARDRGETLVKNISSHTLTQLAELREQLDATMRSIKARETAVVEAIADLARDAAGAIAMKQVIAESLAALQKQLQLAMPETPQK